MSGFVCKPSASRISCSLNQVIDPKPLIALMMLIGECGPRRPGPIRRRCSQGLKRDSVPFSRDAGASGYKHSGLPRPMRLPEQGSDIFGIAAVVHGARQRGVMELQLHARRSPDFAKKYYELQGQQAKTSRGSFGRSLR